MCLFYTIASYGTLNFHFATLTINWFLFMLQTRDAISVIPLLDTMNNNNGSANRRRYFSDVAKSDRFIASQGHHLNSSLCHLIPWSLFQMHFHDFFLRFLAGIVAALCQAQNRRVSVKTTVKCKAF